MKVASFGAAHLDEVTEMIEKIYVITYLDRTRPILIEELENRAYGTEAMAIASAHSAFKTELKEMKESNKTLKDDNFSLNKVTIDGYKRINLFYNTYNGIIACRTIKELTLIR